MTNLSRPQSARSISRLSRQGAAYETVLLIENVHCPSCVSFVQDVLRSIPGIINVDVNILTHEARVLHASPNARAICDALTNAAFDVHHVSNYDVNGRLLQEWEPSHGLIHSHRPASTWSIFLSKAQKKHIENCEACQAEASKSGKTKSSRLSALAWQIRHGSRTPPRARQTTSTSDLESQKGIDTSTLAGADTQAADREAAQQLYEVQLSIGGMTCASCSGRIMEELESLDIVDSVTVNLVANSGTVKYHGTEKDAETLVESIEDIGYEASIESLTVVGSTTAKASPKDGVWMATLSIEGMTCGSCVGTITSGLEELPFVRSVNIDLVGHSGKLEFEKADNLDRILETIDDLGYDAAVVSKRPAEPEEEKSTTERTVTLAIDGMFCHHCPTNVEGALQASIGDGTILKNPTLADPLVAIKYTPSPPDYTMRTFIQAIEEANDAFKVSVYHPPSMEERSRQLQKREQWRVLARLIFSFLVAIPTFIIGIVYMDLVPSTNPGKMWLMTPVWAGSVSRTEWALFIMTTPVMFFGADYFHTRALKEIRALWRPGSKTPILRRLYRFGSMNLLISAGTAVAYFSSLAVLIMDATQKTQKSSSSNDTYFDSVTFLTFFILIGKFLEAYSKAKTGDAVSMLSNLRPTEAHLVTRSGQEGQETIRRVAVDMLEVGDVVSVPHGTSPPSDGVVVSEGTYLFDESSLTGESKPVKKSVDDKVFTGSVNTGSPVQISITEIGGDSMLDQIVAVVREGQTKRAPIERVADILTGYFVPIITLLAIITFVIWVALGESGTLPQRYLGNSQGGWTFWSLEFAIAVFVVACPCGIGLAAPTALFVGGGMAAKRGILVQGGGEAFQEASRIDAIVFDKTGTLTEGGSLKVTEHEIMGEKNEQEIEVALKMAQVMEESSNHPIARAIVEFCRNQTRGDATVTTTDVEEIGGQGMRATFTVKNDKDGQILYEAAIGNQRLLSSLPAFDSTQDYYLNPILTKYQSLGHSTTIIAIRRLDADTALKASETSEKTLTTEGTESKAAFKPLIVFAISDPIRPSTLPVLNQLRTKHKINVHMCTGDNATTAHAVAAQLGIPAANVRANCLPGDKAAYIRELQGIETSNSSVTPAKSTSTSDVDDFDEETKKNTVANTNSNVSPQKSRKESHDKGTRKVIAFVGDGTNDTPALTTSDVSIALSTGSDVALTSSSFILLSSSNPKSSPSSSSPTSGDLDLHLILELVTLSKRVFGRVKLNFAWAAIYNVLLVPVAAGVFFRLGDLDGKNGTGFRLGPVWGSAAMAMSSVSVVCSSLALRWERWPWQGKGKERE